LLAMLLLGVGFGWLGRKVHRFRKERQAVAKIERGGGSCVRSPITATERWMYGLYRPASKYWSVTYVCFMGDTATDENLACLIDFPDLAILSLKGTKPINDKELEFIKALPKLERLYLSHGSVTDNGIEQIRRSLPNCEIHRETRLEDVLHENEKSGRFKPAQ